MEKSWEERLTMHAKMNSLRAFRRLLQSDEVMNSGSLGRAEWASQSAAPLHEAAWCGRDTMVRLMAEAGFNVDSYVVCIPDGEEAQHRMTALHCAEDTCQVSTVRLLLDLGADVSLKGSFNCFSGTPLEWSRMDRCVLMPPIVRMLEEHEAKFPELPSPGEEAPAESDSSLKPDQSDEELALDNKKAEIKELKERKINLAAELASLEAAITEVKRQREEMEEYLLASAKERSMQVKDDGNRKCCKICFEKPLQVFNCVECGYWVCVGCWTRLADEPCPSCRADLRQHKMRRNVTAERLLEEL